MEDLLFVGCGLLWLVTCLGFYYGTTNIMQRHYDHVYNMRNFPRTYLIRYMILPKLDSDEESESSSESESDQESEHETQNVRDNSFACGPDFLRVTFITSPPIDVVKKIKQSIPINNDREILQLIGFEEL